jgi:hypothetical protein
MSTVIGPISWDDWYFLVQLKDSIKFMKEKNPNKYRIAIDKESLMYKNTLKEVVLKEAA